MLTLLHLKKKTKMNEQLNEDDGKKVEELPSTSSSYPMLPTPKLRSKGRTAALVKKFSLTPKKSPPKELGMKKSGIPLRTATSVETISNTPQLALQNCVEATASVSHHSMSEMNLVNIDYRQENSIDNIDVGVKVGQTQYRSIRGGNAIGGSPNKGGASNLNRGWNASSNLSIKSGISIGNNGTNSKMVTGRKSTSTEKLQITISGKKRTNTIDSELQQRKQPMNEIESKRIERKPLQQQQQPSKKLNINHDLTLMNTVGVPPAPTTQAPSSIPLSYRTVTTQAASIKNVVQSDAAIKAQSTMQSQQSVDSSASAVNVVGQGISAQKTRAELLTVTSFDVDDPDDITVNSKLPNQEKDTSLLTEIIEAERRNSITMDLSERGRRYPGIAASETIKFSQPSTSSSEQNDGNDKKPLQKTEIIPKVIIDEVPSLQSESKKPQIDDSGKSGGDNTSDQDNELTLYQANTSSSKLTNEDNEQQQQQQPAIQFEVGKQVRPIFPSNQNLHLNTYSALDNDPATSFLTTSSYIDTHNDSYTRLSGEQPLSAPNVNLNDKNKFNLDDQIRTQQQLKTQRVRRRIAYIESSSKLAASPSTSNSTINTEDDIDHLAADTRIDTNFTAQFSNFHTTSTFITDFIMPPYGDLVWDDDGVIE